MRKPYELTKDLALALISELKRGKRTERRHPGNRLEVQVMRDMINKDRQLYLDMSKNQKY